YPDGAATLSSNRAIRFLPAPTAPTAGAPGENPALRPAFALLPNQPNPATGGTTLRFTLDRPGPAELILYDIQGRAVRRLLSGRQTAGAHAVVWDGLDGDGHPVTSGIYFSRLKSGERTASRRLVFIK
ncbi:MAG: T9SS type A sorting domain-containing protein, partial [Candidatus Eisenbacteria bacterium]|nr:T9SS type A sorting domain-containing protein [Candidatus Eisenbacteria bacterium]